MSLGTYWTVRIVLFWLVFSLLGFIIFMGFSYKQEKRYEKSLGRVWKTLIEERLENRARLLFLFLERKARRRESGEKEEREWGNLDFIGVYASTGEPVEDMTLPLLPPSYTEKSYFFWKIPSGKVYFCVYLPLFSEKETLLVGGVRVDRTFFHDLFEGVPGKANLHFGATGKGNLLWEEGKSFYPLPSTFYLYMIGAFLFGALLLMLLVFHWSKKIREEFSLLLQSVDTLEKGGIPSLLTRSSLREVQLLADRLTLLGEALKEKERAQEEMMRLRLWREAARRIAHAMRSPLSSLALSLAGVPHGKGVSTSLKRLQGMVDQLSRFGKLSTPTLEKVNLVSVIETAVQDFLALHPNCQVQWEMNPQAWMILGDRKLLQEALHNLMQNSWEAGGDEANIQIRVYPDEKDPQWLVVEVRDEGPGVPEDLRDRLFDTYVSSKGESRGMGLAIVRWIVKEHRGEVGYEPLPKGSRFSMRFPRL